MALPPVPAWGDSLQPNQDGYDKMADKWKVGMLTSGCRVARSIVEAINRRALFRCKHLFIQGDIRGARFSDSNPPALSVHSDINRKNRYLFSQFRCMARVLGINAAIASSLPIKYDISQVIRVRLGRRMKI
jgi:hypothetical protein